LSRWGGGGTSLATEHLEDDVVSLL
jgi:hypothetical protein